MIEQTGRRAFFLIQEMKTALIAGIAVGLLAGGAAFFLLGSKSPGITAEVVLSSVPPDLMESLPGDTWSLVTSGYLLSTTSSDPEAAVRTIEERVALVRGAVDIRLAYVERRIAALSPIEDSLIANLLDPNAEDADKIASAESEAVINAAITSARDEILRLSRAQRELKDEEVSVRPLPARPIPVAVGIFAGGVTFLAICAPRFLRRRRSV